MEEEKDNQVEQLKERGEAGAAAGGQAGAAAGEAIGTSYAGPIGGMVGKYIGEKIGSWLGDKAEDELKEQAENAGGDGGGDEEKKKGGACGGGSGSGAYKASDKQCHKTPKPPKFKLEIDENDIPENWWDKLPDFDPRVYDAIAMEQAAATVDYIFKGLPPMPEIENKIEARKGRKTCPKLKANVPRTKVIKPKEVKYETTIDTWMKKDQTY